MSVKKKLLQAAAGNAGGGALRDPNLSFLSHFDGDNNGVNNVFEDSSSNNNSITVTGSLAVQGSFTPFSKSEGEWGVAFDGASDYLRCDAALDSFTSTSDVATIDGWFNWSGTTSNFETIVACNRASNGNNDMVLSVRTDGTFEVRYRHIEYVTSATVSKGEWNFFSVQFNNGSNTFEIFLNGSSVFTNSSALGSSLSAATFLIGAEADAGNAGSLGNWWSGYLSNIRVSDNVRSVSTPDASFSSDGNTEFLSLQSNRFKDNSTNGNTVTQSGTPKVTPFSPFASGDAYDPAVNGGSGYFGTTDKLTCSAVVPLTGDYTIEGWAYQTGSETNGVVCSQYLSTASGRLLIQAKEGNARFFQGDGSQFATSNKEMRGQWCHFVLMRNGSNIYFYVNGTRVFSGTAVTVANQNFNVANETDGLSSHGFTGWVSNLRVTSSAEYSADATITVPTAAFDSDANTELLLRMDNAQAFDSAARGNLRLLGNAKISNAQSKFGDTSFALDGTGDYGLFIDTQIGNEVGNFGTSDFTIECWFRSDQFDSLRTLISKYKTVDGLRSWRLFFNSSSQLSLDITEFGTGSGIQNLTTASTFSANTWYHLAVVRNGATITIYINGTADSNTLNYGASTKVFESPTSILIGAQSNSSGTRYYFDGYIDELRISRTARYTEDFTPPTAPFADEG